MGLKFFLALELYWIEFGNDHWYEIRWNSKPYNTQITLFNPHYLNLSFLFEEMAKVILTLSSHMPPPAPLSINGSKRRKREDIFLSR
jgi:hypothetical protein